MTFSYSGDPGDGGVDEVRFLVHDTDEANPLLSDEEIDYVLARQQSAYNDPLMAAAICADMIANRYASEVSITADGVSISGDQLMTKWQALATSLRETYKSLQGVGGEPLVGGVDLYDRRTPGVRPLSFGRGMHDNMRAGSQDYGQRADIPYWPYEGWY